MGIAVGLLVAYIAKRKSLPQRNALLLSLFISAACGAFLVIPIYLVGLMGAAL